MTGAITFTVPGEPQGKGRAKFGQGRTYTPGKTVAYEGLIALAAERAMDGRPPLDGPVKLSFTAVCTIPASASKKRQAAMLDGSILPTKTPDMDNILKALGDGLNKVAFRDDCQIVRFGEVEKIFGLVPGLTVTVEPYARTS